MNQRSQKFYGISWFWGIVFLCMVIGGIGVIAEEWIKTGALKPVLPFLILCIIGIAGSVSCLMPKLFFVDSAKIEYRWGWQKSFEAPWQEIISIKTSAEDFGLFSEKSLLFKTKNKVLHLNSFYHLPARKLRRIFQYIIKEILVDQPAIKIEDGLNWGKRG